ncbi:nucleoside-diphosphate-sugar epimerase [Prosthecomicrobium pneumaticum]|uniref:Nucleoside-diphosphate-sugar epimerase n=1 Tax=Prosthecomicrobium pneumaticum TaxID=81895 RepID=A0A7W9CUF9_9HYPH|nr:nucleoside-diphosphate-sugar epimerase [Prosthecomicrobium pneumaticum]
MSGELFVFGLGYSARAFVERARGRYRRIGGTVRTAEKAAALRAEGIAAVVFDGGAPSPAVTAALRTATHLLVSVAPGAADPVLAAHGEAIAAAPALEAIVYLSTVGVYGDHGGGWVDEATPPAPKSVRSIERVAAETAWTALGRATGVPVALLRLAGIYGPRRNALADLAAGTARRLVKPGQVFNRIHVEDIAAAIDAAFAARADGPVNVCDDAPSAPQDVVAFAAGLMGVPPPPETDFATADLSPMARSFYGENKRVSNRRLREHLGVDLAHPSYREGLTALWRSGRWRG